MVFFTLLLGMLLYSTFAVSSLPIVNDEYQFYQFNNGKLITGGYCIEQLIKKETTFYSEGKIYKGVIGECSLLTEQERYHHQSGWDGKAHSISFEGVSPPNRSYGFVVITEKKLTHIKQESDKNSIREVITSNPETKHYKILDSYTPDRSLADQDILRIGNK